MIKIFVSSVQSEFAEERAALAKYIREDALLGDFFEVFLFEEQPAMNRTAADVYLGEVESCDIYLGIFGEKYGSRDVEGVSPTEREYDLATELGKKRLGFVKTAQARELEEARFIKEKIDAQLSRNAFTTFEELRGVVYKTLVNCLKEDDLISNKPFDQSFSRHVTLQDLDPKKIRDYVKLVLKARKTTFASDISDEEVLIRVGAMEKGTHKIRNGAIPLFAAHPEEFKRSWEIRCVQFYGTKTVKPVPSLHTYNGTVFELVDQALDFVMSRVDFAVGAHNGPTPAAETQPEFPADAIQEAIVNAVCHRDYRSNACVQVMLFRDRLEIINPGALPDGITREDLYRAHESVPRNEVIATAMSWTSYVEKSGSGTGEILEKCTEHGLARPEFDPTVGFFKTVIWRKGHGAQSKDLDKAPSQRHQDEAPSQGTKSRHQVSMLSPALDRALRMCGTERAIAEIMASFGRTDRTKFRKTVIRPLLEDQLLEMTIPDKPQSRFQKYRMTKKARELLARNK